MRFGTDALARLGHVVLALVGALAIGVVYVQGLDWALERELARAERDVPIPDYLLAKAAPRDGTPLEVASREYDALLEWQASSRIALLLLMHELEREERRAPLARRLDADMDRVDLARKSASWLEILADHYEGRGQGEEAGVLRRLAGERGAALPFVSGMPLPREHVPFQREMDRALGEGGQGNGREGD